MSTSSIFRALPFAAISFLLLGCDDPTPSKSSRLDYENTGMAVTTVKQKLQIDGCEVTIHRITTASSDLMKDFTLGTAQCPTATVTSTEQNCGKNCHANSLLVEPRISPQ